MPDKHLRALRAAFPHTIPILAGFLCLGTAYGIYMGASGFPFWLPVLMSFAVFAGSMQFVACALLLGPFDPVGALLLTLMMGARHLFYGLSMLERYHGVGARRVYMIFGLCDETFSINVAAAPPADVDRELFFFYVTLLNQSYWVAGTLLGCLGGSVLSFDTRGISFVMTALFVVMFLEQWKRDRNHLPALLGLGLSAACLFLFGGGGFILPAMLAIAGALLLLRPTLEKGEGAAA